MRCLALIIFMTLLCGVDLNAQEESVSSELLEQVQTEITKRLTLHEDLAVVVQQNRYSTYELAAGSIIAVVAGALEKFLKVASIKKNSDVELKK